MIRKVRPHPSQNEDLLFELSSPGKTGYQLPRLDVPPVTPADAMGAENVRREIEGFPEVSEVEVVRHFTRLSTHNYSIDHGLYPLGSCTMKYNPRINEAVARVEERETYFFQAFPGCRKEELYQTILPDADQPSGFRTLDGVLPQAAVASQNAPTALVLDEWDKTHPSTDAFLLDFLQQRMIYLLSQFGLLTGRWTGPSEKTGVLFAD